MGVARSPYPIKSERINFATRAVLLATIIAESVVTALLSMSAPILLAKNFARKNIAAISAKELKSGMTEKESLLQAALKAWISTLQTKIGILKST